MQYAQLAWLIPLFPLLAFATIILTPIKHNKMLSSGLAILMMVFSWGLSWAIFFVDQKFLLHEMEARHPYSPAIDWLPTGTTVFQMSLLIDGLALAMLFMVPFVVTMIFIYSTGYHNLGTPNVEPRYSRFFAYVSLFAAGMLTLAISGNMLLFFIAWEIMGLCSYLLIGFWFEKGDEFGRLSPRLSALKAFLTTRVGDVLFFAGLMLLYAQVGTLNIHEALTHENIEAMKEASFGIAGLFAVPVLPMIALLIFGGAVGKSAQFPLHVWLPDAMAGPTPVSAMIHAATMVAAGVFLVARMLPLFEPLHGGSDHLMVVALIGAFTAFYASTIAVAQNDVKGVLAYSTISQLGYMIAALGLGGLVAGVFHMLTHAFFKALLFMASGSVIHGMEHGVHHLHGHGEHDEHKVHAEHGVAAEPKQHAHADDHHGHIDPQNMWNMGGLQKHMPITFWTFMIGGAALAGFPFITAGFWSKDEILGEAFHLWQKGEMMGGLVPLIVFVLLTLTAFLTAFYTGRQLGLTFFGAERTEEAKHAHESPPAMTIPLIVLSIFAILAGFANIPEGITIPGIPGHYLGHMLENVHLAANEEAYHGLPFDWRLALISVAGVGFMALGIFAYRGRASEPLKALGPLWTAMERKWYMDEIYQFLVIRPAVAFSQFLYKVDGSWLIDPMVNNVGKLGRNWGQASAWVDRNLVDGTVNLVGIIANESSEGLKRLQTGRIQNYLVILLGGLLFLAGLFFR
ncbi:MAG: NADH-quinone oxidoreductase subunit L [Ardenticatenales bacterium]|nr:NADH-quinone oxidoreductase subunit L [Ardenticatenales bacterium]